jgi:hypothetical protein
MNARAVTVAFEDDAGSFKRQHDLRDGVTLACGFGFSASTWAGAIEWAADLA